MNLCKNCSNLQLSIIPDFKLLFSNYLYKSSVSKEFSNHFVEATIKYIKEFKLKKKSFIIDIGSNDGVGLLPFKNLGFTQVLPNTDTFFKRCIMLPMNLFISDDDVYYICKSIKEFYRR